MLKQAYHCFRLIAFLKSLQIYTLFHNSPKEKALNWRKRSKGYDFLITSCSVFEKYSRCTQGIQRLNISNAETAFLLHHHLFAIHDIQSLLQRLDALPLQVVDSIAFLPIEGESEGAYSISIIFLRECYNIAEVAPRSGRRIGIKGGCRNMKDGILEIHTYKGCIIYFWHMFCIAVNIMQPGTECESIFSNRNHTAGNLNRCQTFAAIKHGHPKRSYPVWHFDGHQV